MLAPDLKGYFLPKLRAQPFNFSHVPLVGQHLFLPFPTQSSNSSTIHHFLTYLGNYPYL